MRRRYRVFNQHGRYLGETSDPGFSIGASLWELLHPGQVQAEYQAEGKPPPSVSDVMDTALTNISQRAQENVQSAVRSVANAGKIILVGVLALGVLYVVLQARRKRR